MSVAVSMSSLPPAGLATWRNKPRTLVVDDSPTILQAICSLLEHHKVVELVGRAESGTEAIAIVDDLKPELVLIDADMPGMSGLRTSLLLAQSAPETRVVLMSMDTTPQFQRACAGCGAYAVIYKPKFLSELLTLLNPEPTKDWSRTNAPRRGLKKRRL